MILFRFILVFSIALLFGCATGVKMDPAIKPKLSEGISISPSVALSDKPHYFGPEEAVAGALAGIPAAMVVTSVMDVPTKIKNYLKDEKINVAAIVFNEFKQQMKDRPDLSGYIRDNGRYRLELAIPMYGIAQKHAFSSEYKPLLVLKVKMLSPEGKVIWSNFSRVSNLNGETSAFTYDSYFNNPDTFKAAFASAAKAVVLKALNDLK